MLEKGIGVERILGESSSLVTFSPSKYRTTSSCCFVTAKCNTELPDSSIMKIDTKWIWKDHIDQ